MKVSASLSRNGVALSTNKIKLYTDQSQSLLLKVPTANSGINSIYKLRIEGQPLPLKDGRRVGRNTQGFLHESNLDFTSTFLSITIRYTLCSLHSTINHIELYIYHMISLTTFIFAFVQYKLLVQIEQSTLDLKRLEFGHYY